jgi:hypothetical protein
VVSGKRGKYEHPPSVRKDEVEHGRQCVYRVQLHGFNVYIRGMLTRTKVEIPGATGKHPITQIDDRDTCKHPRIKFDMGTVGATGRDAFF